MKQTESESEQATPRLHNRADGVDGHYCIGRPMPDAPAFVEYWNKGKWTSFGELFESKETAELKLAEILELDHLRNENKVLREGCEAATNYLEQYLAPTAKARKIVARLRAALKEAE